jgi:hypothetical protein
MIYRLYQFIILILQRAIKHHVEWFGKVCLLAGVFIVKLEEIEEVGVRMWIGFWRLVEVLKWI